MIGTQNPDISAFRDAGEKTLSWHDLADELIPVGSSVDYYNRVRALDGNVDDYFDCSFLQEQSVVRLSKGHSLMACSKISLAGSKKVVYQSSSLRKISPSLT
jgi:hypothetical protein